MKHVKTVLSYVVIAAVFSVPMFLAPMEQDKLNYYQTK